MLAGVFLSTLLSSVWIAQSFVDPCSTDPCDCNSDEDPYCSICHSNGCNLCDSGYFKADYNYPCVQCQVTFGNECLHCQDFNGCGQCSSDYVRTYDATSDLWYCALDTEDDSVTVQIADATLVDDYDTTTSYIPTIDDDEEDDPFAASNNNVAPSALDLLQSNKAYDIDYDTSEQYETTFSQTYLNTIITNDWFNTALESSGSDDNNTNSTGDIEVECDCSEYCNNTLDDGTTTDDNGNRRSLRILGSDKRSERFYPWGSPSSLRTGLLMASNFAHGECTAALIGPNTIITAAHCVHSGGFLGLDLGHWYTNRRFYPSRTRYYSSVAYSVGGCRIWYRWKYWKDYNWDIAVCRLATSNTGRGWFKYANADGSSLSEGDWVYLRGYPTDKPYGTQWMTYGTIWDETKYQLRSRNYDTYGMLGSPVYKVTNFGNVIYGVHSGSGKHWYKRWFLGRWRYFYYNRATKINTYIYYSICQYMNYQYC